MVWTAVLQYLLDDQSAGLNLSIELEAAAQMKTHHAK